MSKPSRYMWKKFVDCFDQGCRFWTSEDGYAGEWVIMRSDDWRKWLDEAARDGWDIDKTITTMREGFVYRGYTDPDYFDGPYPTERRGSKSWYIADPGEVTPFPVLIFDPVYLPRESRYGR